MRRLLVTLSKVRCPFRCSYCFTDFTQYERPISLEDVERAPSILDGVDVIYPACDVDLFATPAPLETLARAADFGVSISVSTKAALSAGTLAGLDRIARVLRARSRILKVGISVSTKYRTAQIEPAAPSYLVRIRNLRLLADSSVDTCLVMKPILSDIPAREYCEILDDVAGITGNVLVGEEYLDSVHPRIPYTSSTVERCVTWIGSHPIWPANAATDHLAIIRRRAAALGLRIFSSDLDLVAALIDRRMGIFSAA
jgi:DNA repair photolyase